MIVQLDCLMTLNTTFALCEPSPTSLPLFPCALSTVEGVSNFEYPKLDLWMPSSDKRVIEPTMRDGAPGAAAASGGRYSPPNAPSAHLPPPSTLLTPLSPRSLSGADADKARTPAPDLPSLLLENRIVYLGMPLVPAVTELIIAELLYLQYRDRNKPIFMYINSTGCARADGETVGFETEGTAIYDTMQYIKNEIPTIGVGLAFGQACMILSAGQK